jgi:hypothetical protein
MAETSLGLGQAEAADLEFQAAIGSEPKPKDWMIETATKQMQSLRRLLAGER